MVMDKRGTMQVVTLDIPIGGGSAIPYSPLLPYETLYPNPAIMGEKWVETNFAEKSSFQRSLSSVFREEMEEKYPNTFFDDLFDPDLKSPSTATILPESSLISGNRIYSTSFHADAQEATTNTNWMSEAFSDTSKINEGPTLAELNDTGTEETGNGNSDFLCLQNSPSSKMWSDCQENVCRTVVESTPLSVVTQPSDSFVTNVKCRTPNLARLLLSSPTSVTTTDEVTIPFGLISPLKRDRTDELIIDKKKRLDECENTSLVDSEHFTDQDDMLSTLSESGSIDYQELEGLKDRKPLSSRRGSSFFWQYNVHGKRKQTGQEHLAEEIKDPHHLPQYADPVFNPNLSVLHGVRHGGKARRGDGNDLNPDPSRLYRTGLMLTKLIQDISNMTAISELPPNTREAGKRQKNKLASRACRLKKKAHHEANKVKLFGLDQEHEGLMRTLKHMKCEMRKIVSKRECGTSSNDMDNQQTLSDMLGATIISNLNEMVAGHTTEFVNATLLRVERGDSKGGLAIKD